MKVKSTFKPTPMPPFEEVERARKVINEYWLSVYQALYAQGLTNPCGAPVEVKLCCCSIGLGAGYELVLKRDNMRPVSVYAKTTEEAVAKAKLLISISRNAVTMTHACCPLARARACVCEASFDCPLHGKTCHGSHD